MRVPGRYAASLDAGSLADLEALLAGWLAPADSYRLDDIGLCLPAAVVSGVTPGDRVELADAEGMPVAALTVTAGRPGAERVELAGRPHPLRPITHRDFAELRRTPAGLRAALAKRGWQRVVALVAHEVTGVDLLAHAAGVAASLDAGLLLLGASVATAPDDLAHFTRVRGWLAALDDLAALDPTARGRCLLCLVPLTTSRAAGPAAARAAAAAGATHLLGGDPAWAHQAGLVAIALSPEAEHRAARMAAALAAVDPAPPGSAGPRLEAELARAHPPRYRRGFVVLLSGLSGSGKSTIAGALLPALLERDHRAVTLLDGDLVRHHLSKGLGFSRADRATNVTRIGFVAAQTAKAGGIAVCAPIAPYDETRRAVRKLVEQTGAGFVLVHVATPLEVCEARDRKGLYAKARAGEIREFTGISDPYDEPSDAELVVDTTELSVEHAAAQVLGYLERAGWLAPS